MRVEHGYLLRIYVGEGDKHNGRPLYKWIVSQAHDRQLSGATAHRGLMGFGPHTRTIHTFKIERLAEDIPITIEIVDSREKIDELLTFIEQQVRSGLISTLQAVEVRTFDGRAPQ